MIKRFIQRRIGVRPSSIIADELGKQLPNLESLTTDAHRQIMEMRIRYAMRHNISVFDTDVQMRMGDGYQLIITITPRRDAQPDAPTVER